MADAPARNTPGPDLDPLAAAAPLDERTAGDDAATAVDAAIPSAAEHTDASASDVELVGRTAGPRAQLGDEAEVPVLVGVGSFTSVGGRAAGEIDRGINGAPPLQRPAADAPVWSFRDGAGRGARVEPSLAPADRNQVELPFTPATELVASAAPTDRPQPLFGPVGRGRSPLFVALLSALTLGVYALVWHHRINRELEEFDPKVHARPMRSAVAVAVPWVIGLLTTVAGAALIVGERLSVHLPLDSHVTTSQSFFLAAGLVAVPYLTLLVPFSLVAVVMTLERLRCVEEHVGTTTDRQVRAVGSAMLLAVPLIGGLVLLGVAQRRLNAVWAAVAPSGRLSL